MIENVINPCFLCTIDCFMDEFDLKGFSYREVDAYIWEAVKINQNFICYASLWSCKEFLSSESEKCDVISFFRKVKIIKINFFI